MTIVVWYGLLLIRSGFYEGAVFKFTLSIPITYPEGGCPVSVLLESVLILLVSPRFSVGGESYVLWLSFCLSVITGIHFEVFKLEHRVLCSH